MVNFICSHKLQAFGGLVSLALVIQFVKDQHFCVLKSSCLLLCEEFQHRMNALEHKKHMLHFIYLFIYVVCLSVYLSVSLRNCYIGPSLLLGHNLWHPGKIKCINVH